MTRRNMWCVLFVALLWPVARSGGASDTHEYDLSGESRPTEFATKAKTKLFLVTYRRMKP
jgi:hypothetical protein